MLALTNEGRVADCAKRPVTKRNGPLSFYARPGLVLLRLAASERPPSKAFRVFGWGFILA